MLALCMGLGLNKSGSPETQLSSLIASLGGSLWLPNVSNFENTTIGTGIDDPAEDGDPIAYAGDLSTYNLPENLLKNSGLVGAALPSTAPTNWTYGPGVLNGVTISQEEVGSGYVILRVAGTATATSDRVPLYLAISTSVLPAAKAAELWSASINYEIAGTYPANVARIRIREYDSSPAALTFSDKSVATVGNSRLVVTRQLVEATAAHVSLHVVFAITSGVTYDFTVKISQPQLERGRARSYVPTPVGGVISRGVFNPAYQATTSKKPLLRDTSGRKNWLFDNVDDFLLTSIRPTSAGYMCVAARHDVSSVGDTLIGAYKATAAIQSGVSLDVTSGNTIAMRRTAPDGTTISAYSSNSVTSGETFIADAEWGLDYAKARKNGAGEVENTLTQDGANTQNCLLIGANNTTTAAAPSGSAYWQGAIFGAVHIPSVPTDAQKSQIRKLLAQIAGVPGVI